MSKKSFAFKFTYIVFYFVPDFQVEARPVQWNQCMVKLFNWNGKVFSPYIFCPKSNRNLSIKALEEQCCYFACQLCYSSY